MKISFLLDNIFLLSLSHLKLLTYDRNIFGRLRQSSENIRKMFRKWSEIFGKSSKTPSLECLYNKQNITCPFEDTNFIFSCSIPYLTHLMCSLVRYRVEHLKIKFVSTLRHIISSIYPTSTSRINVLFQITLKYL